jgi:hypothetical protein
MAVHVSERLVVEFAASGTKHHWIPANVRKVGGASYVTLSTKDRGFARLCDAKCSEAAPLAKYGWLDAAVKLRTAKVNEVIDKVASEKLFGHKSGSHVRNPLQFSEDFPEVIGIEFPPLSDTTGPMTINVIFETVPSKLIWVECTTAVVEYVRAAMIASRGAHVVRPRPQKSQMMSTHTGVSGVHKNGGRRGAPRFRTGYVNQDGKRNFVTSKSHADEEPADMCKQLRHKADTADAHDVELGDVGGDVDVEAHASAASHGGDDEDDAPLSELKDGMSPAWKNIFRHA